MSNRLLRIVILFVAGTIGVTAQETRPNSVSQPDSVPGMAATAILDISTEPQGAEVVLDSLLLGKSPIMQARVAPGGHTLTVAYPSLLDWNAYVVRDSMDLAPAAQVSRLYTLQTPMRVDSRPQGAAVLAQGGLVGTTPLYGKFPARVGALVLAAPGCDTATTTTAALLSLQAPLDLRSSTHASSVVRSLAIDESKERVSDWPAFAAASVMIASGVLAAYFKDQANRNFDAYSTSGDAALLSRTRSQDRISGTALVVTEISFGVLSYLLLSD